jgi:hypothetical protein
VLGDLRCVSGTTTDEAGAPLADVSITAIPVAGGLPRTVASGADGSFCVPAAQDAVVDLVFDKRVAGRRLYSRGTFGVGAGPAAACGGAGCESIGPIALLETQGAGCFRGSLLSTAGQPYNDVARAQVGDIEAAIRPRDDGSFCVDIIAGNVTITDPVAREGCADLLSTSALVPATGLSCAAEDTCPDVGEIDFSSFCSGS